MFLPVVKIRCFHFTDYWHIGCVVLGPAVHYLGPRGVVSPNDWHISIGLPLGFNRKFAMKVQHFTLVQINKKINAKLLKK